MLQKEILTKLEDALNEAEKLGITVISADPYNATADELKSICKKDAGKIYASKKEID